MGVAIKQNFDFAKVDLSSAAQVAFYDYWQEIRGDRLMPSKADFDPMRIPQSLPYIVMEGVYYDPLRFKIRLIGSKCKTPNSYLGKFINDIPEIQGVEGLLAESVRTKKPYFYYNDFRLDNGIVKVYSSLVLPFSEDGDTVTIIMACQCMIE